VVCLLVGIVVSWWIAAIGAVIALVFGALWILDVVGGHRLTTKPPLAAAAPGASTGMPGPGGGERFPRNTFLEAATLGLGAMIGAILMIPPLFLALIPPFLKQGRKDVDVGPLDAYPEGEWIVATFTIKPGQVNNRTAFIRNNGLVDTDNGKEPSFTVIWNRCAHLGCPTQPNALVQQARAKKLKTKDGEPLKLIPAKGVSGFGCPCHGGQYDSEGNRTAGPPVRALDRFEFSIKNGRLLLGKPFSVSYVEGTAGEAKIHSYRLAGPGNHVDGWEQVFYPVQPPS
jgi:menaquinol-cytochrome c reductase iron-sulfur subunit